MIKTSIQHWVFIVLFHMRPVTSHIMVTLNIWMSNLCERRIIYIEFLFAVKTWGQIWILWCYQHQFEDLRQTSWPTGQAVQWYSGLMFHVVYLDFYLTFSKFQIFQASWSLLLHFIWNFPKFQKKQVKFCANVQMDQFPLHESAVIRWSTYEYDMYMTWIILWMSSNFVKFSWISMCFVRLAANVRQS